jgi:dimethylamine/trimethylamine dehydrogenase
VLVTARLPEIALCRSLRSARSGGALASVETITRIGDGEAPGAIVQAVYAGHRYARELGVAPMEVDFRRDRIALEVRSPA